MRTCINFGANCVGCGYVYCIDARKCFGMCGTCINNDCDNHPQRDVAMQMLCYADEL